MGRKGRKPIDQFSIDYDMPLPLANRLVGRTESETEDNIAAFIDYLRSVMAKYHDPQIAWEQRR